MPRIDGRYEAIDGQGGDVRRDTRLRRRWLKAGVPALVAALALGVAACGGDDDGGDSGGGGGSGQDEVRLGAFILASENTYAQKNLEGVEQAAQKAGNVTVQSFDGKFDGRNQLNQIQDAIASGNFDAFVVFPNDGAQVAPGVEDAAAAGIKTVAAYAPIGSDIDTGIPTGPTAPTSPS
jgi:ribose transport system substrate-binding protein